LEFLGELLEECGILGIWSKKEKERECKRTVGSMATVGFLFRYVLACMVSLLVLACMAQAFCFLVMNCYWHGGIPKLMMDLLSLAIS